jgi:hypothetical protein
MLGGFSLTFDFLPNAKLLVAVPEIPDLEQLFIRRGGDHFKGEGE